MNRTMTSILRVLDVHGAVLGSREISRQLREHGVILTERTVRYHMRILDERGFTEAFGKEGRKITAKGKQELACSRVSEKMGFVISRIEALSFLTTIDTSSMTGEVILNISFFPEDRLKEAIGILRLVFASPYVMSSRLISARSGENIGEMKVPEGMAAIGTVCSVTVNGIFLKAGIPVTSRFGGVLEIQNGRPIRFVSLISYEGSSVDPLEIFIRSRMTDVIGAVRHGSGKVLASFREIPVVCRDEVIRISRENTDHGIGGVLILGEPNTPLMGIPVGLDKAGMVVVGGLNPVAALEEVYIPTESKAMAMLHDYATMKAGENIMEELI